MVSVVVASEQGSIPFRDYGAGDIHGDGCDWFLGVLVVVSSSGGVHQTDNTVLCVQT